MSYIDIFGIKKDIVDILRKYLYPRQTITSSFYDNTISSKYAQSFIPFSSSMDSISIYCNTVGTDITPLTISIQEDSNGVPSGTRIKEITFTQSEITNNSWDTKKCSISNLISKNKYWLVLEHSGSSSKYYKIGHSNSITSYLEGIPKQYISSWNTISGDICFKIHTNDWIYPYFPSDTITENDLPRIAVEIFDRSTEERYCSNNLILADIKLIVVGYSQYSDELDKIFSYGERGLFKERTNISNITLLTPLGISPLERIDRKKYSKSITYNLRKKMKYTSTVPVVE
jgi:hypothetical protein